VAVNLNNLAAIAHATADHQEAEHLNARALRIKQNVLGRRHPDVAMTLNNLALLYKSQGRLDEARALYERSLAMFKATFGPGHPKVLTSATNYAFLLRAMGRGAEAQDLEAGLHRVRRREHRRPESRSGGGASRPAR
jgi:tetratricopeptide (TPR) repeat protein